MNIYDKLKRKYLELKEKINATVETMNKLTYSLNDMNTLEQFRSVLVLF